MRLQIGTLGLCVAAVLADAAPGQTCSGECSFGGDYMSLQTGDWDTTSTWCECDGEDWVAADAKPGASNRVIITRGTTVTVDSSSEACDDLTIQSATTASTTEGVLIIASNGGELTVGGALNMQAPDVSENPCRIEFSGTTGNAGLLVFSEDVTADQEIVGNGKGRIEIAATKALTLLGIIESSGGAGYELEIDGELVNDGDVNVVSQFNVKFTGTGLHVDSAGTILVNNANASVQWLLDSSALDQVDTQTAEVLLRSGLLNFDTPLTFKGVFEMKANGVVNTEDLTGTQSAMFCEGASCS